MSFKFTRDDTGAYDCLDKSGLSIREVIAMIVKYHREQAAAATGEDKAKLLKLADDWGRFAQVMSNARTVDDFIVNSRELLPRLIDSFIILKNGTKEAA
ncbi:MAG: hypothetical protein BWY90_00111 [Deltaproteobacteria bacterium ADurb.BinA014]|nr:MAG: hypothetical protein BWY90_00111 [Deltaproteobacteria bacterium ADurb.BinA014]